MNLFAFVSVAAAILCLGLGLIVLYLNPKSALNRLFLLVTLTGFAYCFTTVMMWTASSAENALVWHKAGTIWPFFAALVLNFALVFTNNSWIKNKLTYLAIYLPAVAFWLIDLTTYYINTAPVMEPWGFNDLTSGTWVYVVSTVWAALLPLLAFTLCLRQFTQVKDPDLKKRAVYVTVGFAIPIAAFIITNMLTRSLGIDVPNLGVPSTGFLAVFVGYATAKYDLFTIDAALAAENILSTIPDSLVLTNNNLQMMKVNERLVDFSGYKQEELIGVPITKLFVEDNSSSMALAELVKRQKIFRDYEVAAKTKNGEIRHVLFSGSVVETRMGHPIGLTFVIHDISELKKIEERLIKAERLASIGELAGQLGHDIRNPLGGIKNGVYFLRKKGRGINEKEWENILGAIDVAVEDSNRIVTSLVDYSSELYLEPSKCTPKMLVDDALAKVKVPPSVTVENDAASKPEIQADVSKLENVFVGIIENAIQATSPQGKIQITSAVNTRSVEIIFSDNGAGIPKEILPKLFTPLVTTKAKGMGMSLAICKRVVEAHNGKVTVTSANGEGTTFTVSLPLNSDKNTSATTF